MHRTREESLPEVRVVQHLRRTPRNAERKKSVPRRPPVLRKVQSQSEDDQRSCRQPVETAARQKARRLDRQTGWFHIMAQMLVSSLLSKQAGENSTNSQFFITLAPASHLDNKHSVFGEVVGNIKLLDELESIGSDKNDKPLKDIKIINIEVYTNPFRDVISELLIKEFSEKFGIVNSEIELEKKIDKVLNQKIEAGDIGKYLGKKRGMLNYVAYSQTDPYVYEKPNRDRKGKFDFTNW